MSNLPTSEPEVLTGKLSVKHKLAINAIALFLEWVAGRLKKIETYEEGRELGEEIESKARALDQEHGDNMREALGP